MRKSNLITAIMLILMLSAIAGCSTNPPYVPPAHGEPRAYLSVQNNCNFLVNLTIDDFDAGSISRGNSKTFDVAPGAHNFNFRGTDEHISEDLDFPVFFQTNHTFVDGETFTLPIRFGVE